MDQVRDSNGQFGKSLGKSKWDSSKLKFVATDHKTPKALKPAKAYMSVAEVALQLQLTAPDKKAEKLIELLPQMSPANRRRASQILLAAIQGKAVKS